MLIAGTYDNSKKSLEFDKPKFSMEHSISLKLIFTLKNNSKILKSRIVFYNFVLILFVWVIEHY